MRAMYTLARDQKQHEHVRRIVISLLKEYWEFLREEKKRWMLVIVVILLLVGVLVTLTASPVAPFIYALF